MTFRIPRRLGALLLALALCFTLLPAAALADGEMDVIQIPVGGANDDNENYTITDTEITLKKLDVVYELSGTTDRNIIIPGIASADDAAESVHIRMNGAAVGMINPPEPHTTSIYYTPSILELEVVPDTTNSFTILRVTNLTIYGSGTLNGNNIDIDYNRQGLYGIKNGLSVTDTEIELDDIDGAVTINSDYIGGNLWHGAITFSGNADVTVIGDGIYPVIKVSEANEDSTSEVILKDNASLRALQRNPDEPGQSRVDGFQLFHSTDIILMDNSYLECWGKDGVNYKGGGILNYDGALYVSGNAEVRAYGYGLGIYVDNIDINGGRVTAFSNNSNAIYSASAVSISGNANVTADGYYPAIYSVGDITVSDSTVTASSSSDCGVYTRAGAISVSGSSDVTVTGKPEALLQGIKLSPAEGEQFVVRGGENADTAAAISGSPVKSETELAYEQLSENTYVRINAVPIKVEVPVPPTYEIDLASGVGGTVSSSLSNASAGSTVKLTVTPDEGYRLVYITVDGERISGTSFVMPDHDVEVRAVFAPVELPFTDVSSGAWYYDAVSYVYENGLMDGVGDGLFNPDGTMTRAMVWAILARMDGETVTGDNWKTMAQNWAVSEGVSDGTEPDALVTREQFATMLYRYAGEPEVGGMAVNEFSDAASVSDWAYDAVVWALSEGIITGTDAGLIAPQGTATRAQAAAMLMRFCEGAES